MCATIKLVGLPHFCQSINCNCLYKFPISSCPPQLNHQPWIVNYFDSRSWFDITILVLLILYSNFEIFSLTSMKINAHLLGVWLLVGKKCFVAEMGLSWANKCICNLQWSHAGLNLLGKFWSSQRPEARQCVHGTQWAELLLLRLELQAHDWWKLNMSFWCLWQLDQCSPFSYGGYSGIRLVARRANKLQHVGPVIFAIQASKLRPSAQGSGVFLGHTGSVGAIPEVQEKLRWDSHTGKIPWTFGDDTTGRLRAWGWPQTERLLTFCWDQSQRSRTCCIEELHLFNLDFRLVLLPRILIGTIDCCSMHEPRTLLVWNLRTGWVLQKQFENEMLRLHITSVSL